MRSTFLINVTIILILLVSTVQSIRPIEVSQQIHDQEINGDQPPLQCALTSLLVINEMQTHAECKIVTAKESQANKLIDPMQCPTNAEYNQCEDKISESYSNFLKACGDYVPNKKFSPGQKNSVCREVFQHKEA